MKNYLFFSGIILTLLSCNNREKKKYAEYFDLDKSPKAEQLLLTRKKPKVPFPNNKIYDPFASKIGSINLNKSSFEYTDTLLPKLTVLKKRNSVINIAKRTRKPLYTKGLPLIIENTSSTETLFIPMFRGKAVIIQEALNKKKEWVEIEYLTKEKLGYYHYKVHPNEYIYTKIPLYDGEFETKLRVKMKLNDSTTIYSNTYKGNVHKRVVR
jgi:hypothetical protein